MQGKINNMEVVDNFESGPHEVVTFLVEGDNNARIARVEDAKGLARIQRWDIAGRERSEGRSIGSATVGELGDETNLDGKPD